MGPSPLHPLKPSDHAIPTIGKFPQQPVTGPYRLSARTRKNPGILPFFKFGTPPAKCWASSGTCPQNLTNTLPNWRNTMTNTANNFAAAAFSIVISSALFAYAIVPASPTMFA